MAISFSRYVDITSSVIGANGIPRRQLIGRLFTDNNLLPPQSFAEFDTIDDVGAYFGTSSVEYLRAQFYFSWISKNGKKAPKISFARWVDTSVPPMIFGAKGSQAVASYTPITTGSFTLTLNGVTNTLTGLNFSAAASLSDIAGIVQAAIRAETGTLWTGATVTWDSVNQRFNFVGGLSGAANIIVVAGSGGNDVAAQLGWLAGAILGPGSAVETITNVLTESAGYSNNFGSFLFIPTLNTSQITEAALWTHAQNVKFEYDVPVTASNAAAIVAACAAYSGVGPTLSPLGAEYPEMAPMMVKAATDYSAKNSVQNYMYQTNFALTPSVMTDADANTYDALGVNYYGVTQSAGQFRSFYQRGRLLGPANAPLDMNVFANEQWFKDAIGANIVSLLLDVPRVPANAQGRGMIIASLQTEIQQAKDNGTISVNKILTPDQVATVTALTGDPLAWNQVQNAGDWLDVEFEQVTVNNALVYQAAYTLIYSKDDAIRKVVGTHLLN